MNSEQPVGSRRDLQSSAGHQRAVTASDRRADRAEEITRLASISCVIRVRDSRPVGRRPSVAHSRLQLEQPARAVSQYSDDRRIVGDEHAQSTRRWLKRADRVKERFPPIDCCTQLPGGSRADRNGCRAHIRLNLKIKRQPLTSWLTQWELGTNPVISTYVKHQIKTVRERARLHGGYERMSIFRLPDQDYYVNASKPKCSSIPTEWIQWKLLSAMNCKCILRTIIINFFRIRSPCKKL